MKEINIVRSKTAISLRELVRVAVTGATPDELDSPPTSDVPEALRSRGITAEQRSRLLYDIEQSLRKTASPKLDAADAPTVAYSPGNGESLPVRAVASRRKGQRVEANLLLFDPDPVAVENTHRFFDLRDLVREAWSSMFQMWPEDHVVINPLLNREFVARCRAFGTTVAEYDLNRALLNGRKAGLFSGTERAKVAPPSREEYDRIDYACELAGRYVQYRTFDAIGSTPTIDRILCDPKLRASFDAHAVELMPSNNIPTGNDPLVLLRLGLLRFRKSGRESSLRQGDEDLPGPLFRGRLCDIDPEKLPNEPGIYRISAARTTIFLSYSLDLRERLLNHTLVAPTTFVPASWNASFPAEPFVSVFPAPLKWKPRKLADVAYVHKLHERPTFNLFSQVA